jgi:hypothetical protein
MGFPIPPAAVRPMICRDLRCDSPGCRCINPEGSRYCRNCGSPLQPRTTMGQQMIAEPAPSGPPFIEPLMSVATMLMLLG